MLSHKYLLSSLIGLSLVSAATKTAFAQVAPNGPRIVRAQNLDPQPAVVLRPIRERRRLLVLGEISYNGLSGLGVNAGYQIRRYFAIDAGVGLAAQLMPKIGLRARFDFLRSSISPFAAFGATFVPGQKRAHVGHFTSGAPFTSQLHSVAMVTGMLGMSIVEQNGFTFLAGLGAALRVSKRPPYTQVPAADGIARISTDLLYGDGLLASVAFGYSF